jgi:hypothetical protein
MPITHTRTLSILLVAMLAINKAFNLSHSLEQWGFQDELP